MIAFTWGGKRKEGGREGRGGERGDEGGERREGERGRGTHTPNSYCE